MAFSKRGQFVYQFLAGLEAGEFVGEELEGSLVEVGEGRANAVGGEGHAVVAGGSGDDGSAHADVGRDAGGH